MDFISTHILKIVHLLGPADEVCFARECRLNWFIQVYYDGTKVCTHFHKHQLVCEAFSSPKIESISIFFDSHTAINPFVLKDDSFENRV